MAAFNDLPIELLPLIISHLLPKQLVAACLVNKNFYTFAAPSLYQVASVFPWHKDSKTKLIQLFRTLAFCPDLASHVRRLEIKVFPKSLRSEEYDRIMDLCLRGLSNAINLKSCSWTRHGSINTRILQVLQRCSMLDDLEINGHHLGHYDPLILKQFTSLQKIRLIMPSALVIETLPAWLDALQTNLKVLSIICKSSPLVTDASFKTLSPQLVHLEELNVVGCTKLSHEGILAAILANVSGIKSLSIEGLSPAFDIAEFSRQCQNHNALRRLTSFTITIGPTTTLPKWTQNIVNMLSRSPLEYFQIYCSGGHKLSSLDDDLCKSIASTHKDRLRRFSVHRIPLSLQSLDEICTRCVNLEQLFIVVERDSLDIIGESLSKAPNLRVLHINVSMNARAENFPEITPLQLISVVEQCRSTVTQVGCNTTVWQVEREPVLRNGQLITQIRLGPYDRLEVPEQFRVVQT